LRGGPGPSGRFPPAIPRSSAVRARPHGALGAMTACYLRDPDQNLIELGHYPDQDLQA